MKRIFCLYSGNALMFNKSVDLLAFILPISLISNFEEERFEGIEVMIDLRTIGSYLQIFVAEMAGDSYALLRHMKQPSFFKVWRCGKAIINKCLFIIGRNAARQLEDISLRTAAACAQYMTFYQAAPRLRSKCKQYLILACSSLIVSL